ncbi:MAG TPA: 5'-methylthioadenosine/S-adenosylhomocysteine nucleosidase [Anaerolineales bacterium]|nr:5'-methylthioadenosine/S-adenosylhomocysteine nucleosidase [Anaerolineales bacterium]
MNNESVVVLVSANIEWQALRSLLKDVIVENSPYGEWFLYKFADRQGPVLFFHEGWGKIAAAAATQYVIDRWRPELLINLGTCGGFAGQIQRGAVVLVERTVVYDIIEQMGDFDAHIAHYATEVDLSWLKEPYPQEVIRTLLVSGDRDLIVDEVPHLYKKYGAVAGDWESGAIAWVAQRNQTRCLILRGVTDLVGDGGGEAYDGNIEVFENGARQVMDGLVATLPAWIGQAGLY